MISIKDFFSRIGGIHAKEIAFRSGVQSAIKEIVGTDVPIEYIKFESGSVLIKNIPSVARSTIFIKKAAIMERINTLQSVHKITDIR